MATAGNTAGVNTAAVAAGNVADETQQEAGRNRVIPAHACSRAATCSVCAGSVPVSSPARDATAAQRGGKNLSCGMSWMYVSPRLCPQSCPHVS